MKKSILAQFAATICSFPHIGREEVEKEIAKMDMLIRKNDLVDLVRWCRNSVGRSYKVALAIENQNARL